MKIGDFVSNMAKIGQRIMALSGKASNHGATALPCDDRSRAGGGQAVEAFTDGGMRGRGRIREGPANTVQSSENWLKKGGPYDEDR